MNFTCSDNVFIFFLSCNVKTTSKWSKKSRNKHRRFSVLILLPFLTVAQHELGTRKAISWSVTIAGQADLLFCFRIKHSTLERAEGEIGQFVDSFD